MMENDVSEKRKRDRKTGSKHVDLKRGTVGGVMTAVGREKDAKSTLPLKNLLCCLARKCFLHDPVLVDGTTRLPPLEKCEHSLLQLVGDDA